MTALRPVFALILAACWCASAGANGPTSPAGLEASDVEDWREWRRMNDRNDLERDTRGQRATDDSRRRTREAEYRTAVDRGVQAGVRNALWALKTYDSYVDFRRAFDALDDGDGAYDPDLGEGPTVPSGCAESDECNACYARAVERIDFNRFWLHRAWSITHSHLTMAKKATAFGDSASGFHGMSGLAWQLGGKPQIEQATGSLRNTYRSKSREYLDNLESAMRQLGECEAEHFDERDWYGRFGFLYVSFMRGRYESADP
ncbi:hypothetical protein QFW77_14100 [Luteimonas sp. RD2P54]|uniref:DUF2891 family protein n=1 Tax=Luteimonas endophytica TaxID=3042023 RepID=A0ABT6JBA9_9GAMM|nr:hypothetical protein [Luteimonas endophytica]MDH5824110.1 hypothetical protein [Luteimonas endophytica]